ncbi:MAG: class I SAM-dependent methyltransferase [Candidatus Izimaplasma sp.]|nr:class I SAM-dependent methyltransferase [Candidatus Izimaplasma bacterium]
MVHYFSENNDNLKSNPQLIAFSVNNTPLKFNTDNGVFSKNNFDRGTEILLKYLVVKESFKKALDLGCGYGVIGIYLNKAFNISVDMVDINKRAINLTKSNVELNETSANVFLSDGFENIDGKYDLIITNPPIRAGKEIIYRFFEDANKHLLEDGEFYLVINKKHGADSALVKLKTIYNDVEIVNKKKGFQVIKCKM